MGEYKIIIHPDGRKEIVCSSHQSFVEVLSDLGVRSNGATSSQTELPLEPPKPDFETCVRNLVKHLNGKHQGRYLRLLCENPSGIATDALVKGLGLGSIFAFNGVWSGVVRNGKNFSIDLRDYIERLRGDDGKTFVHHPTSELVDALKKAIK